MNTRKWDGGNIHVYPAAGRMAANTHTQNKNEEYWVLEIRHLLEKDFPDAEKIVRGMDNYGTHI